MLLAVDIGNTSISCAVFERIHLLKRYTIPTGKKDYLIYLRRIFAENAIEDVIICSVVPQKSALLRKNLKKIFNKEIKVVGSDVVIPVKNLYRNPGQVGQDRLVNAYAGIILYGYPLIVIDFGTAITFDIISKKREYLGGMILPGLSISLDALAQRAALLPKIKLEEPQEFIGRDTKNSMLSGIVYGFATLSDGLVEKIKKELGRDAKVIGTGGNINLIGKYCHGIDRIDPDLTLKGLNLIHNHNKT